MIMTDDEIEARLSSPDNLINKLKSRLNGDSFLPVPVKIEQDEDESQPSSAIVPEIMSGPKLDELMPDAGDKIRMNLIQSSALDIMTDSLIGLKESLSNIERPKDFARIATDMSKIVNAQNQTNQPVSNQQVIIFRPIMVNENHYQSIEVNE